MGGEVEDIAERIHGQTVASEKNKIAVLSARGANLRGTELKIFNTVEIGIEDVVQIAGRASAAIEGE